MYRDQIISYYNELKEINAKVAGSMITDHKIADNGVTIVTYDNGVKIYVNYTETDATVDGVAVPALSYAIGGV